MTHRQRSRCQRTREADLDEYLFTLLLSYDVCSENTPVTHVIRGLCNTSFTWVTHLPACLPACLNVYAAPVKVLTMMYNVWTN